MQQHCYFHKSELIQHFCSLKQCTLPLCEQCLEIHEDQHHQKSQQTNIIPYRQAYEQVFGKLSQFVQNHKSPLQTLKNQVRQDKEEALKSMENYFKEVQVKLQQQTKILYQIQQKFEKLKKGSIKTVIYYYSGEITLKSLELPQFKQIQSSLKSFLRKNSEEKKEEIQTFRQKRSSQTQWSESKIEHYHPRQNTHSKKKSIFQNQKSKANLHKNSNQPYLDNPIVLASEQKIQIVQRNPFENNDQRQPSQRGQQRSQVKNYFQNNYNKVDSVKKVGQTNTYNGEMKHFKIESKTLRNFEIEQHLGIQPVQKSYRPLKETTAYDENKEYRETRSRTLDKFPSMIDLKKGRQNTGKLYNNEEEFVKFEKPGFQEHKTGKWNKNYQGKENKVYDQPTSVFSQLTINETTNSITNNTDFANRRPLKTTDLDTYTPSNGQPSFEGRQRTTSYEMGTLRTTVSHNNLYAAGKKTTEPLLGDELKKQVMSPHEIRRMLEKKIQERNKVLTQKKELQLKINIDRGYAQTATTGSTTRGGSEPIGTQKGSNRQIQARYDENTNMNNWGQTEQRQSLYNTKDSIINHIYRDTRY